MSLPNVDAELLPRAIGGDRAALSQLLLVHYDSVRSQIARQIAGDPAGIVAADDLLHQTMVRAAEAVGRFEQREGASFRAWLGRIADNLVKDARKRQRRERRAGDGRQPGPTSSWGALVARIAGDQTSPSGKTRNHENASRLRTAVAALPDEYRQVIECHYLREQSLEEIARTLGCSKGAVRAMCYRARKRLRDLMGQSSLYFSG